MQKRITDIRNSEMSEDQTQKFYKTISEERISQMEQIIIKNLRYWRKSKKNSKIKFHKAKRNISVDKTFFNRILKARRQN